MSQADDVLIDNVLHVLIWRTLEGDVIGTDCFISSDAREQKVKALLDNDPHLVFDRNTVESHNF